MCDNMWQDYVMSVGQVLFIIALLPTIFDRNNKPPLSTSALTSSILFTFAFCFYTLGAKYSCVTSLGVAIVWAIIFFQKLKSNRIGDKIIGKSIDSFFERNNICK